MCHHACMAPCPQPYSQPRESGRPRHLRHHWAKVQTECPSPLRAILSLQGVGLWAWRKRVRAVSTSPNRS